MERLTRPVISVREDVDLQAILDKLACYEAAEECGKLIRIPDEAFYIQNTKVKRGRVLAAACNRNSDNPEDFVVLYTIERDDAEPFLGILGVNVFASMEDVELFVYKALYS